MKNKTLSSLLWIRACCLIGAISYPGPALIHYQMETWQQNSRKNLFHGQSDGHVVQPQYVKSFLKGENDMFQGVSTSIESAFSCPIHFTLRTYITHDTAIETYASRHCGRFLVTTQRIAMVQSFDARLKS